MTPDFFLSGQPFSISVKLNRPEDEIEKVMISLPGADAEMIYNKENDEWNIQRSAGKREALIMDVAFFRIWAVLKDGSVSEPFDLPIKWHFIK